MLLNGGNNYQLLKKQSTTDLFCTVESCRVCLCLLTLHPSCRFMDVITAASILHDPAEHPTDIYNRLHNISRAFKVTTKPSQPPRKRYNHQKDAIKATTVDQLPRITRFRVSPDKGPPIARILAPFRLQHTPPALQDRTKGLPPAGVDKAQLLLPAMPCRVDPGADLFRPSLYVQAVLFILRTCISFTSPLLTQALTRPAPPGNPSTRSKLTQAANS